MFASLSTGGLDDFSGLTVSGTPNTIVTLESRIQTLETEVGDRDHIIAAMHNRSVQEEEDMVEVEAINQTLQIETIELKKQLASARAETHELLLDREELEFALADAEKKLADAEKKLEARRA